MKKKGSITIYLSLILVCISALICGLVESARTAGLRYYARVYADSAIDSLFSEYHRQLWDSYRLLGLECDDTDDAAMQAEKYMKPYVEVDSWLAMGSPVVDILKSDSLTDEGGAWFEQEVLDYMKYAALNLEYDESSTPLLKDNIEEAQAMKDITDDYGSHTGEAAGVEKQLIRISEKLEKIQALHEEALSKLREHDGRGFRNKVNEMKTLADDIPGMITRYESKADSLAAKLEETKNGHEDDWSDLKDSSKELLEQELGSYDTYVSEDGARREEIASLGDKMQILKDDIDRTIEYVDEVEAEIEDSDEEDDVDEDELWGDVADYWRTVDTPSLGCARGLQDEEKENTLERVLAMLSGDIWAMVIPEGRTVSDASISGIASSLPSHTSVTTRTLADRSLLDNLIVTEYSSRFLSDFVENREGMPSYELEYVASGHDTDRENLYAALTKILGIREGLNYMYILSDAEKREAVSALAATIAAVTGIPGLNLMLEYLIIGVWALAESVMDIKALLLGKKVPIYKDAESWQTDLDGILNMASEGISDETRDSDSGITYESYLKFLVFMLSEEDRDYRTMDMIQSAIMEQQEDFRISECIYGMDTEVTCEAAHTFTGLGISQEGFLGLSPTFTIKTQTSKAY